MSRQTRRTFLATVGVVGTAGCTGILNGGGTNTTSTSPGDGETTTEGTTSTDGGDKTTTTSDDTTTSGDGGNGGPKTLFDFEKLDKWRAEAGTMKKHTKNPYQGSQAAYLKGNKQTKAASISYAHGVHNDGKPLDLSGKNLSIAFKSKSHTNAKIDVTLETDAGSVSMKRTLKGPKNRWVRVNLGSSSIQGGAALKKVRLVNVTARPENSGNSKTPIHAFVDDVKVVDAPDKGAVMLTFDDGAASHYSVAYKKMKKMGIPGVDGIIAEAIGDDGYLTWQQMRKMADKGNWDMISHPNTQGKLLPERPKGQQAKLMGQSKYQLKAHGYQGAKYMAVPKNAVGQNTFDLAMKKYDLTMSFGASNNALPLITKDAIASRFYVSNNIGLVKRKIDEAAKLNQLAIPLFHGIGTKDGIPKAKFDKILAYIQKKKKAGEIDVVTPSMLEKQGMLL